MLDFSLNKIFVEGNTDQKMIASLLEVKYNIEFPFNGVSLENAIINCKGYNNLKDQSELVNKYRIENGGNNLIIFDADNRANAGGYEKRKDELINIIENKAKSANKSIIYKIHLLPNNSSEGNLETFYTTCFVKDKQFFKDCWESFYNCLESKNNGKYRLHYPKSGDMVYGYVSLFRHYKTGEYQNTKTKRDYSDDALFEFDFIKNDYLKSLCKFLEDNLNLKSN